VNRTVQYMMRPGYPMPACSGSHSGQVAVVLFATAKHPSLSPKSSKESRALGICCARDSRFDGHSINRAVKRMNCVANIFVRVAAKSVP
jgi:hypothetical protein